MLLLNSFYFYFIKIIDLFVNLALNFVKLTFFIRLEILYSTFLSKFAILSKSAIVCSTSACIFTNITSINCFTHIQTTNISGSTFFLDFLS